MQLYAAMPGVYYERVDASDTAIGGVRTDVAGLVGIAERGPVGRPLPIESWRQFQAHFGGQIGQGYLAYVVRAYFENGGRRCWVVRVASRDEAAGVAKAGLIVRQGAADIWRVSASSPGTWGNALQVRLVETHRAQTRATTLDLARSTAVFTTVQSTSGFERGTLVRLTQPGGVPSYRAVAAVDAGRRRLIWLSDRPTEQLPYLGPLPSLDATLSLELESIDYALAVVERGIPSAVYTDLAPLPEHRRYAPAILATPDHPRLDPDGVPRIPIAPAPVVLEELRAGFEPGRRTPPNSLTLGPQHLPSAVLNRTALVGGRDGLALLLPGDFIGDEDVEDASVGLAALAQVDEVAIVAVPDIHIQPVIFEKAKSEPCVPDPCLPGPEPQAPLLEPGSPELPPRFTEDQVFAVQDGLVRHCERLRYRFAVLDPPVTVVRDDSLGVGAARVWRSRFESRQAALYHPWVVVVDPARHPGEITRAIPPSGHVLGQYARTDIVRGVHVAPANAPLRWVQDVTVPVDEATHGLLNDLGINLIRTLPGRGHRILGARTVSSDPDWRFVPVRRLVLMVMKALDRATQWAVFEPNDEATRQKLRLAITVYLNTLWQVGALAGAVAEEGFRVQCDEANNGPADRAEGRLTVDIRLRPAQTLEFVVLRIAREGNAFEIVEGIPGAGGS